MQSDNLENDIAVYLRQVLGVTPPVVIWVNNLEGKSTVGGYCESVKGGQDADAGDILYLRRRSLLRKSTSDAFRHPS